MIGFDWLLQNQKLLKVGWVNKKQLSDRANNRKIEELHVLLVVNE